MTIYGHNLSQETGGHEIYNFGRGFLAHHYYISRLSARCTGVKKILKKKCIFTVWPYKATPFHSNPCPWGHEIYNFGRGFLDHHFIFILSAGCTGVKKTIFKEIYQFYTFPQNRRPLGMGAHENYNFWSPSPTDATYQIWSRFAQYFLLLLHVMDDDGWQPIEIGYLSDSGDLKTKL